MPANNRLNEQDVAAAVLEILANHPKGEMTIAELVKEIPKHLVLSELDRAVSKTRPNEEMWEQQVRNITSHHKSPGNFIFEKYLEAVKGGLKITEVGRLRMRHKHS